MTCVPLRKYCQIDCDLGTAEPADITVQSLSRLKELPLVVFLFASIAGCASNGYYDFYRSAPGATPEHIEQVRTGPAPKNPTVAHASSYAGLIDAYVRRGYEPIGDSSFSSGHSQSERGAFKQAQEVEADLVVIIDPKYAGSETFAVPITTPTVSTSYTTGTATAFGLLETSLRNSRKLLSLASF